MATYRLSQLEGTDAYQWAEEQGYLLSNEEVCTIRWSDGLALPEALRRTPGLSIHRVVGPSYRLARGEGGGIVQVELRGDAYLAVFPDGSTIFDHPGSVCWGASMSPGEAEVELRAELRRIEEENEYLRSVQ